MKTVIKGYKYRIYPTDEQKELINKTLLRPVKIVGYEVHEAGSSSSDTRSPSLQ